MSEPTPGLPVVRLLDPPALVAADRMNARMEARSAPLLRTLAGGAIRFADRIFQGWLGSGEDRPSLFAAAGRSPINKLPFARPWYDDGRVWPARGITLRAQAALSRELVRGAPTEPRAIDLVASYLDAAEPAVERNTPNDAAPNARLVSIAERAMGRLTLADRIVRAASALFSGPPAEAPAEAIVAETPRSATAPERVLVEPEPTARPRTPAARAVAAAPVGREAMRVDSALPASTPATWPRVQRFLEKLAGPVALARAGVVTPLQLLAQRSGEPTARALSAPPPTWLTADVARALAPAALANEPAAQPGSTLVGEMMLRAPQSAVEGERFAPGRAAQQAELLAQIAEHRGLRQLGYPEPVIPSSPRWSAEAFTMIVPAWSAPDTTAPIAVGPRHTLTATPIEPTTASAPERTASVGERPVPGSIASIIAFASASLGARLETDTRPLPVRAPDVVYIDESFEGATASRRAEPQLARPAAPHAGVGMRSEQLAGEIGVRAAGLTSEFLVESHPEDVAAVAPLQQARGWLSTAEWKLLSVFPSNVTAGEVAYAAAQRAAAPRAGSPRDLGALALIEQPARARAAMGRFATPGTSASSLSFLSNPPEDGEADFEPSAARDEARVARAQGFTSNVVASAPAPRRSPLLHRMPDGRRPRGNRIVGRVPSPVFASALAPSSALVAASEASERRLESPVGPPLWGHLRPLVSDDGVSPGPSGARAESAEPARSSPRQGAVLELLTPFVEAARSESGTQAASMATAATLAASAARSSSASPSAPPLAERLSLADLALISIVSADQEVAAIGPELTSTALKSSQQGSSTQKSATGAQGSEHVDVDDVAEKALQRIYRLMQVKAHGHGELGD
jgi:hypothetical protein